MHPLIRSCIAAAAIAAPCLASAAGSLRCNGAIASEGDSKLSFLYKCGQPLLKDHYCAPLYFGPTLEPVPLYPGAYAPCVLTEEWFYDRGPGNLPVTVRFRSGVVQSIVHGRSGR